MTREFWQEIVSNKYVISSDPSPANLLPELLEMLASTDSVLRDGFAYPILATWIQKNAFSRDELSSILRILEQRLELGLGEMGSDTVFARSFAVLVLAVLVNNLLLQLEKSEVLRLLEVVLNYLAHEKDLRGFVFLKGWAHAVAHTADLLDEFVVNEHCQSTELQKILTAILNKVTAQSVWLFDEEDRLSYAAARVLGRNLIPNDILQSLLYELVLRVSRTNEQKLNSISRHNAKTFLRSLYFQVLKLEPDSGNLRLIFSVLEKFD